jgi:hypothetical protein
LTVLDASFEAALHSYVNRQEKLLRLASSCRSDKEVSMEIDLDCYATVLKLVPGGEEGMAEGTVREILGDFVAGKIGRPGGLFMRVSGRADLVLGKQLIALVEDYKISTAQ